MTTNLEDIEGHDICPECGGKLIEKWSGVMCSECDYWECY